MTEITDIDRARAKEARRRFRESILASPDALQIAAMLARTGWEPVDEDEEAARELNAWWQNTPKGMSISTLAKLAIRKGRELERASRERGE